MRRFERRRIEAGVSSQKKSQSRRRREKTAVPFRIFPRREGNLGATHTHTRASSSGAPSQPPAARVLDPRGPIDLTVRLRRSVFKNQVSVKAPKTTTSNISSLRKPRRRPRSSDRSLSAFSSAPRLRTDEKGQTHFGGGTHAGAAPLELASAQSSDRIQVSEPLNCLSPTKGPEPLWVSASSPQSPPKGPPSLLFISRERTNTTKTLFAWTVIALGSQWLFTDVSQTKLCSYLETN